MQGPPSALPPHSAPGPALPALTRGVREVSDALLLVGSGIAILLGVGALRGDPVRAQGVQGADRRRRSRLAPCLALPCLVKRRRIHAASSGGLPVAMVLPEIRIGRAPAVVGIVATARRGPGGRRLHRLSPDEDDYGTDRPVHSWRNRRSHCARVASLIRGGVRLLREKDGEGLFRCVSGSRCS